MNNGQVVYETLASGGGINTVVVDGKRVHITDLAPVRLCAEWSERQREINALYEANRRAYQGWRGVILRLLGIKLPEKHGVIRLGH